MQTTHRSHVGYGRRAPLLARRLTLYVRLVTCLFLLASLHACIAPALVPVGPLEQSSPPPATATVTSQPQVTAMPDAPATTPPTAATTPQSPRPTATPFAPGGGPAATAHYTLSVDLDYVGHTAQVAQQVLVLNNSRSAWDRLVLHIPAIRREGVFELQTVSIDAAPAACAFDPVTATCAVALPGALAPGQTALLAMAFRLNLPPTSFSTWFPAGNLGYGERVTQFNNWYPLLVPYRDGQGGWYTWSWADIGDPFVSEVATYDLEVHAAPDVVIASGGPVESTAGVTRFHLERARAIGFTASPEYRVAQGMEGGVTLHSYYLDGHAAAGNAVLATMAGSIRLFGELYGPYPYSTYTVAENAYLGSMEYSAFVSHSGEQYARYDGTPNSFLVTLTAHETAHQWWYGLVGSDQVNEPWLDEALASYSETVFYCSLQPEFCDRARARWGSRAGHGRLDRTIYDFTSSADYLHILYPLGGQFVMVVHGALGDESFYAFLRAWRARGEYRVATAREFMALLGTYLPNDCASLVTEYFPAMVAQRADAVLSGAESAAALCSGQP